MASTRNRNTKNDYIMEKKANERLVNYNQYTNSSYGKAYENHINCLGGIPSLPREILSHNPVETESYLLGINSTNLENPAMHFRSEPKEVCFKSFFERQETTLPEPLKVEKYQRVNYLT